MIRNIHCLGCEGKFEAKLFIEHAGDCKRSNNVPPINLGSVYTGEKQWNVRA